MTFIRNLKRGKTEPLLFAIFVRLLHAQYQQGASYTEYYYVSNNNDNTMFYFAYYIWWVPILFRNFLILV
jgi:hypothetical protein